MDDNLRAPLTDCQPLAELIDQHWRAARLAQHLAARPTPQPVWTVGPDGATIRKPLAELTDEEQMRQDLQAGLDRPWQL